MASVATTLEGMRSIYENVASASGLFGQGTESGKDTYIDQRIKELQGLYNSLRS
jgi:hypothetical protein